MGWRPTFSRHPITTITITTSVTAAVIVVVKQRGAPLPFRVVRRCTIAISSRRSIRSRYTVVVSARDDAACTVACASRDRSARASDVVNLQGILALMAVVIIRVGRCVVVIARTKPPPWYR
jgi:hypothetical protein